MAWDRRGPQVRILESISPIDQSIAVHNFLITSASKAKPIIRQIDSGKVDGDDQFPFVSIDAPKT
jgi:hypothetical protein